MKLTIHRGTQEIGGSCVQISAGNSFILLDAGLPLGESPSTVDLAKIDFTDVFISHPHQDHFGLIEDIAADKTVHIGETALQFIAATRIFLGKAPLSNRFHALHNRTWVDLEPYFRVKPYLMDHSCMDAFGFLVEVDGKRLYYSGDFRAHGRRKKAFDWFLSDPPRDIDVLLMEGTMMGRGNASFADEKAVEQGMLEVLRTQDDRACFLVCSGQHIDRLYAAYQAAKHAGRVFVLDIYTAYVLRIAANRFPSLPDINSAKDIRVLTKGFTAGMHYSRINDNRELFGAFARDIFHQDTMITIDEILAQPTRYLFKVSYFNDLLESLNSCSVIFSMWPGYLEQPKYRELKHHPKVTFHEIHTSGHAVREDLHRFAAALKPKCLIPIHTEKAAEYESMFDNVSLLCDGETLEI